MLLKKTCSEITIVNSVSILLSRQFA